jgi:hypothetical protein
MRVHPILIIYLITALGVAQTPESNVIARVTTVSIEEGAVTLLHLAPGYTTSVKLPEEISSVVVGDPASFKAEHSDAEPRLVFLKPITSKPSESNALVTTKSGHEITLHLVSVGNRGGRVVDDLRSYPTHRVLDRPRHGGSAVGGTGAIEKTTMTTPQILTDLLQLLFDMAVPAAMCTMVLAGLALRQESGVNFEVGGRFQRWMLWSVILLTLPQFLSWFAAQGITMPPQGAGISGPWLRGMETSVTSFISDVVVAKLVPILAAFFILKAALDAAQGWNPLGSIVSAIFLLGISGSVTLMQGFNSGGEFATTDMLASLWNYLANTILPEAAGLAVAGAVINYARKKPFMPLVFSALAFLSVTGLWKLVQAMVR